MHGFNKGKETISELFCNCDPSLIMLQEHWLTPDNLNKLDNFDDHFCFGSSALTSKVESGIRTGKDSKFKDLI